MQAHEFSDFVNALEDARDRTQGSPEANALLSMTYQRVTGAMAKVGNGDLGRSPTDRVQALAVRVGAGR